MPIYFSKDDSSVESAVSSLASLNLADSSSSSSSKQPSAATLHSHPRSRPSLPSFSHHTDMLRRTPGELPSPRSPYHGPHPATPPHASRNHPQTSYFPPHASYSSMNARSSRASSASTSPGAGPSTVSPPMFPLITTSSSNILRNKSGSRTPTVTMTIESTSSHYTLVAPLGAGYTADGITIAARKENVLMIIADRWDEEDCKVSFVTLLLPPLITYPAHHEWQVHFGRDGDMSGIHASFENGMLRITVKRLHMHLSSPT